MVCEMKGQLIEDPKKTWPYGKEKLLGLFWKIFWRYLFLLQNW